MAGFAPGGGRHAAGRPATWSSIRMPPCCSSPRSI